MRRGEEEEEEEEEEDKDGGPASPGAKGGGEAAGGEKDDADADAEAGEGEGEGETTTPQKRSALEAAQAAAGLTGPGGSPGGDVIPPSPPVSSAAEDEGGPVEAGAAAARMKSDPPDPPGVPSDRANDDDEGDEEDEDEDEGGEAPPKKATGDGGDAGNSPPKHNPQDSLGPEKRLSRAGIGTAPIGGRGGGDRPRRGWWAHLEELSKFKRENGHCEVPNPHPPNPSLARWCARQRKQRRYRLLGLPSSLTGERQRVLEAVGFDWHREETSAGRLTYHQKRVWEVRLQELAEFQRSNGHCCVPNAYPPNKQLGLWVKTQRRYTKLMLEGKGSYMTEDRLVKLNALGFFEYLHAEEIADGVGADQSSDDSAASDEEEDLAGRLTNHQNRMWKMRLEELTDFRKKNGHCYVPNIYPPNKPLGLWVKTQRRYAKLKLQGKPSYMTEERWDALDALGFFDYLKNTVGKGAKDDLSPDDSNSDDEFSENDTSVAEENSVHETQVEPCKDPPCRVVEADNAVE